MELKKNLMFLFLLIFGSVLLLAGCGGSSTGNSGSGSSSNTNETDNVKESPSEDEGEIQHFTFGYDQPKSTAYGIAANIFAEKLEELSGGTMIIDQFPGAQLGSEPEMLQKIRNGDIDFMISSTANASTVAEESGVFSLHYIFESEEHLKKVLASPEVAQALKDMFKENVTGAQVLTPMTLGMRQMYSKNEIASVEDMKGKKVRVQATKTEDTHMPAYGSQTVHMAFGEVYTSLQTGVMDVAENGINVYLENKHFEVAPVLSLTEHAANNSIIWISDKVMDSLTDEQKEWVQLAAEEVGQTQPELAFELEHNSIDELEQLGVKIVKDVDKSEFIEVSTPIADQLAEEMGPHAVKILELVRSLK